MSKNTSFKVGALAAAIGVAGVLVAPATLARDGYLETFASEYPTSQSGVNANCALCHTTYERVSNMSLNPYGVAIARATGATLADRLGNVEGDDSDGSGFTNLQEIEASAQPGWTEGDTVPTGVIGLLDPEQVAGCFPVVDPSTIDFGTLLPGESVVASAFVTNNGDETCAVAASVAPSGEFVLESADSFDVLGGDTAQVDVSYTPADLGDDTGLLTLAYDGSTIEVELVGSSSEALVDMDIKSFRVTKKVSVSKGKGIVDVNLTVENGGDTEGSVDATVTGVQDGKVVYNQTVSVTDAVGGGANSYTFQSYIPDFAGDIIWMAVIADDVDDPDEDTATATTTVTD